VDSLRITSCFVSFIAFAAASFGQQNPFISRSEIQTPQWDGTQPVVKVVRGELTGDGHEDLVYLRESTGNVRPVLVYAVAGNTQFVRFPSGTEGSKDAARFPALDPDSGSGVLLCEDTALTLQRWAPDTGRFQPPVVIAYGGSDPRRVAVAETAGLFPFVTVLEGDSTLRTMYVLLTGDIFVTLSDIELDLDAGGRVQDLALVDLTGDAVPELVVARESSFQVYNSITGQTLASFDDVLRPSAITTVPGLGPARKVLWAGTSVSSGSTQLFLLDASMALTGGNIFGAGEVANLSMCDYDADGDQDLFLTRTTGQIELYPSEGAGSFPYDPTNLVRLSAGAGYPERPGQIALAHDYDNDGDGDLAIHVGTSIALFLGKLVDEDALDPAFSFGVSGGAGPPAPPQSLASPNGTDPRAGHGNLELGIESTSSAQSLGSGFTMTFSGQITPAVVPEGAEYLQLTVRRSPGIGQAIVQEAPPFYFTYEEIVFEEDGVGGQLPMDVEFLVDLEPLETADGSTIESTIYYLEWEFVDPGPPREVFAVRTIAVTQDEGSMEELLVYCDPNPPEGTSCEFDDKWDSYLVVGVVPLPYLPLDLTDPPLVRAPTIPD